MIPSLRLGSLLAAIVASTAGVTAAPSQDAPTYYDGLKTALSEQALTHFWHALEVANDIDSGRALVDKLYSDDEFTLYVPVNAAWESSNLTQPPANGDLVSLLSYHIVQATLNSSTDIAPSRRHTIAFTELRSPTVDLPGDQTQVMVLQTAEDPATGESVQGEVLIRGDNWNASSVGQQFVYENLYIQPIDKPSPLIKTLSQTGLAILANMGATSYVEFISGLGLQDRLASCHGCTFFVPVNRAFEEAGNNGTLSALTDEDHTAIILNHILNSTVEYSPSFSSATPYITAAGTPLLYLIGDGGKPFVSVGKYRAGIVRANIPVSNGVVHLIDTLMISTINNVDRAEEAAESLSRQAEGRTTTPNVIGVGITATSTSTPMSTVTTITTPIATSTGTLNPSSTTGTGADSAGTREFEIGAAGVGVKMGLMVIAFGAAWL
ncbi:hypothetical protein IAT40_000851 [Kwoniella sp. CBS 6097]